jgi:hypothetical protein
MRLALEMVRGTDHLANEKILQMADASGEVSVYTGLEARWIESL